VLDLIRIADYILTHFLKEQQQKSAKEVSEIQQQHHQQMSEAQQQFKDQLDQIQRQHKQQIEELTRRHQEELEAEHHRHEAEVESYRQQEAIIEAKRQQMASLHSKQLELFKEMQRLADEEQSAIRALHMAPHSQQPTQPSVAEPSSHNEPQRSNHVNRLDDGFTSLDDATEEHAQTLT